jgi:hypothetical protein
MAAMLFGLKNPHRRHGGSHGMPGKEKTPAEAGVFLFRATASIRSRR